jgi:hypothetical protein
MGGKCLAFVIMLLLVSGLPAHADRLDEIERQIQNLQEQLRELKEDKARESEEQEEKLADLEERIDSPDFLDRTEIGGYMELHYNDTVGGENSSRDEQLDFHRFVLFFNHQLSDWIQFYSEVEIEHAFIEGGEESGEVELEQAYVDFLTGEHLNYRAGVILTPVGIINQFHEPATFNGVERPFVDTVIIPTTWSESGAGIFGNIFPGLSYQLNLMGGLEAEDFSASSGLRGGRQKAFKTNLEDLAIAARLDYAAIPGLALGASYYLGDSAQDLDINANVRTNIWEGDFRYSISAFDFRGEVAHVNIGDAAKLNTVLGKISGTDAVAEELFGWYLEGAYHFLPLVSKTTSHDSVLFVRYEEYDTQKDMPNGFAENPAFDREAWTIGLTYWPIETLAIKADYQDLKNDAGTGEDLFNLGVGWQF